SCRVAFSFLSSRRRHTTPNRDWSSDVCSSDLGRQCLVEALTAHADAACEFAEVPRSGDRTERLRNERGIIAVFECGLEVCGCVAKVAEVVGTLVWAELLNRVVHGSSIPV